MSTVDRRSPAITPPLVPGQRLGRATFHARYEAMPPSTRAELIGGVVHMPSPLSYDHGDENGPIVLWLMHYQRFTPGVRTSLNTSTLLDDQAEAQPDASLRILPESGGRSRHEGPYIAGAPELVVEIARSSRRVDLDPKLRDYERAGVLEYVVSALGPDELLWHARRDDRLVLVAPDAADGLHRSAAFRGLWLDPVALVAGDLDALVAALDRGLATDEHRAFVDLLAGRRDAH
ncbi:MAG TPA: Uma2 family endonuclease [Isosphaeraceae bacterium]|nr:Uma2 family endonuclease [Isosphaeraceae bacterium]